MFQPIHSALTIEYFAVFLRRVKEIWVVNGIAKGGGGEGRGAALIALDIFGLFGS